MGITELLGAGRELGARFTLIGYLPALFLALFVLALIWSGAPSDPPDPDEILAHARDLDAWEGGLLVLVLIVAALLVQPFQLALVRAFEGYWGRSRPARALADRGRRGQARRLEAIEGERKPRKPSPDAIEAMAAAELARRTRFPHEGDDLLPTALGNVLRAAETWGGARYGLQVLVVWPRLFPLLSEPVRSLLDDRRDQLDLAVRFAAVFALAAVISLALLLPHGAWLAVAAGCALLAWASYRSAISAALAYGEAIHVAVDLHRFDLLAALHLPAPPNLSAERELNARLSAFLLAGTAPDGGEAEFDYTQGSEA